MSFVGGNAAWLCSVCERLFAGENGYAKACACEQKHEHSRFLSISWSEQTLALGIMLGLLVLVICCGHSGGAA